MIKINGKRILLFDSLSNSRHFSFNVICTYGEMKVISKKTLYFKLILGVAHISVNYQKINKISIVSSDCMS